MTHTRRTLAAGVIALALLPGCPGGEERPGALDVSPTVTTRPRQPAAVHGRRLVATRPVANGPVVFHGRRAPAPKAAAVTAFAEATADWLDAHLTDLQRGGSGRLRGVAATGLLRGASPALLRAVGGALASPDRPVRQARYQLLVAHAASPQWLRAAVEVTAPDGRVVAAQFVFVPGSRGRPVLVAAGPGQSPTR